MSLPRLPGASAPDGLTTKELRRRSASPDAMRFGAGAQPQRDHVTPAAPPRDVTPARKVRRHVAAVRVTKPAWEGAQQPAEHQLLPGTSRWRSSQADDGLQSGGFGFGDSSADRREPVIPALGLLPFCSHSLVSRDQAGGSQPREHAIERAELEPDRPFAGVLTRLREAVRVAGTLGQGEQDLEIVWRQRLEVPGRSSRGEGSYL